MKKCIIIKGTLNWVMKVDGETIPFNTQSASDYFEKHYTKLGYYVERTNVSNEDL